MKIGDSSSRHEQSEYVYIDDNIPILIGTPSEADDYANEIIALTNQERINAGLEPLEYNTNLSDCAYIRAEECCARFSHTRPNDMQWWTVNSNIMYGENLAKGFNNTVNLVSAWMNSQSHKENILSAEYKTIGVAVFEVNNIKYVAQEFGY